MKKTIAISAITISFFVLLISFYWHTTNKGDLWVSLEHENAAYKITRVDGEFRKDHLFEGLRVGEYQLEAYGKKEGLYKPTVIDFKIERNKKTTINVWFDYKEGHGDFSGEELDIPGAGYSP